MIKMSENRFVKLFNSYADQCGFVNSVLKGSADLLNFRQEGGEHDFSKEMKDPQVEGEFVEFLNTVTRRAIKKERDTYFYNLCNNLIKGNGGSLYRRKVVLEMAILDDGIVAFAYDVTLERV